MHGDAFLTAPFPGSCHENPRSCAGALWRAGMVLFAGEGVPSPSPSPGDIPTVRRMG